MSDDLANSTPNDQATTDNLTPADAGARLPTQSEEAHSSSPSQPGDQEQGDRSKSNPESRINGLMSLVGERTTERDQALAEVEALKGQLADLTAPPSDDERPSQMDLLYPPEPAQPEPAGPEDEQGGNEFPVILPIIDRNAAPRNLPGLTPGTYNPTAMHLRDQQEIALMKRQLNTMGQAQFQAAKDAGKFD